MAMHLLLHCSVYSQAHQYHSVSRADTVLPTAELSYLSISIIHQNFVHRIKFNLDKNDSKTKQKIR